MTVVSDQEELEHELDFLIAVIDHINHIEPDDLIETIIELMERDNDTRLGPLERAVAGEAVLRTYNAIVGGAAFVAATT